MNTNPAISVLMPVYNADRYIKEAIESVLNQTFGDFELLIIDDGSTDRSLSILKRYAAKDARIRLTSRPNTGYVRALNEMLAQARGEFIARMDADDVAMPDRFAHQVAFLRQHPQVVCVGGAQDWVDEAGRLLRHNHEVETDAEIQQRLLTGCTAINHPSAMFRRSTILQIGGYDETMCPSEDLDLWLKMGEIGELANLGETVTLYRQHSGSVSELRQIEQNDKRYRACEQAWKRRGVTGHVAEIQPWRPFDRPSRHQFMLDYGWRFFMSGQRQAAIVYGWRAVQALPLQTAGWRLLVCALIKPLPVATP
jgi:glycosyltransferase involved in cell wall biosynthesis